MKDKKIQILMSTYNGEKYISRQLNSIVKQDVPVSLLIRERRLAESEQKGCYHKG